MTKRVTLADLLDLLEGDRDLVERCLAAGHAHESDEGTFDPADVERVLVTHTLVRELEVNWAGVDIILRMREALIETRRQIAKLLARIDDDDLG